MCFATAGGDLLSTRASSSVVWEVQASHNKKNKIKNKKSMKFMVQQQVFLKSSDPQISWHWRSCNVILLWSHFFFLIKMKCAFWGRINVLVQMRWQLQNLMDRGSRRPIVICNLGSVCTPERQTINIKSYLLQTEDLYCTTFTHIHKNTIYIQCLTGVSLSQKGFFFSKKEGGKKHSSPPHLRSVHIPG